MVSISNERIQWIFQTLSFWKRRMMTSVNKTDIMIANVMIDEYQDIIFNVLDMKDEYEKWKVENPQ